jgi:DNA-binding CsgD family transcriptional regulator
LGTAQAQNALGSIAICRDDYATAAGWFDTSLALMRRIGDDDGTASLLAQLGYVDLMTACYEPAVIRFEGALEFYRRAGSAHGTGKGLTLLGHALVGLGEWARARESLAEGLRINQAIGHEAYVAHCLEGIGALNAKADGKASIAARLWGAAETLRGAVGAPLWPTDRARLAPFVAKATTQLGAAGFAAAWAAGGALDLDAAIAEALAAPDRAPEQEPATASLSGREVEVLRLIAAGMTDREIAAALFVSHRTAQNHAARIFQKLGVRGRAQAVAAAIAGDLIPVAR